MLQENIVLTGVGCLSPSGDSIEQHLQASSEKKTVRRHCLEGFDPKKFIENRKILRAISTEDAIGLAAVSLAKLDSQVDGHYSDLSRVGFYVGAPSASPWDNLNYFEAMSKSFSTVDESPERAFGRYSRRSKPMTILQALPNNVLAYGAILAGAKGCNGNYTAGEIGGQFAVNKAAKQIKKNRIDAAMAGGFSAHAEPVYKSMLTQNDWDHDDAVADGACFWFLEKESRAKDRGAYIHANWLGGFAINSAKGLLAHAPEPVVFSEKFLELLGSLDMVPADVGLVFFDSSGVEPLESFEHQAIKNIWPTALPVVASSVGVYGNWVEAGGLIEIELARFLYGKSELPEVFRVEGYPSRFETRERRIAVVIKTSIFGSVSCILLEVQ